jgi:hypothetical protein
LSINLRRTLTLCLVLAGGTSLAEAQATRTWVSGVGDDVNPCSRTAPCKTFAGAISKTAPAGEINVLDPGAYGAVTITKSISIVADSNFAGVLATLGSNGIIVNAAATDVVVLRGLDLLGNNTGANAIRFLAGAALHVENCQIHGFTGKGIEVATSTTSQLFVRETVIRNNVGASGGGIFLSRTGAGSVQATLERVRLVGNRFGLRAEDGTHATVRNSEASGNNTNGFVAVGASAFMSIDGSSASDNTNNGISVSGGGTVRLSDSVVTGNGTGLNGSAIVSFGNNRIAGNGFDGAPTSTIGQQ